MMTMRLAFLTLLLAALPSCSLLDNSDEPLTEIWHADDDIADYHSVTSRGGLDDERFYTIRGRPASSTGTRELAAFRRADGTVAWQAPVNQPCSPPVVAGGRVFCPAAALYAFNATTGAPLWTTSADSSLALVEGTADASRVFAGSLTAVYAADAATGAPLWRRHFAGPGWVGVRLRSLTLSPEGELLVAMEALYSANGFFSSAAVVALDPATGEEQWRYEDGGPATDRAIGSLTLWGRLMLYSDATGQEAVAVDRATRAVVWRAPWTPGFLGPLRAPVVADGIAYYTDGAGKVFSVDAATGTQGWSVAPSGGGFVNHEVCGSVVLADNTAMEVVRRADGASEGNLFDASREIALQMAVDGRQAYIGTTRGVYAFDCG